MRVFRSVLLSEVISYLRQAPTASCEQVQCGSCVLDHSHVVEIEKAVKEGKVRDIVDINLEYFAGKLFCRLGRVAR